MAYKMPLVVKEIYIPCWDDDQAITLDEYREKYGIDLREFFTFDSGGIHLNENGKKCKIYIVSIYGIGMAINVDNNGDLMLGYYQKLVPNADDVLSVEGFVGFQWDNGDKTITFNEI